MPEFNIKTSLDYDPGNSNNDPKKAELVEALFGAMPGLIIAAWETAGWEDPPAAMSLKGDIVPPFNWLTLGAPSVKVTVRPHWTEPQAKLTTEFMAAMTGEIVYWTNLWVLGWPSSLNLNAPRVDVDLDFIVGAGSSMAPSGIVDATWPDESKLDEVKAAVAAVRLRRR